MARERSEPRKHFWRILFERSERSERSELCAGPWTRAPQGSRRSRPPNRSVAACPGPALPAAQPMQHAAAERIRRVAAETAERVSALLLLSRAPDTVSAPQTLLNAIIEAEISRCQPLLAGKEVHWQRQDTINVSVAVHPELAAIVIGNLLRNACRHTEAGYISVQLSQQQLIIEDSGSGIPGQIRERLFERFVHGDTQPPHEGTGLGLAIVKRVADHAGWHIVLQDADGGGSRFVITFPAATGPVSS